MREQIDFEGRVAIVTGGAGGIGGRTVREFAKEGADVVVADVDAAGGEALAEGASEPHDGEVRFVETDVSDYEACRDCVETTVEAFGGVDVLVNGATSRRFPREERFQQFVDQNPSHWEALVDVTLMGAVNMSHNALQVMDGGAIVTISSETRRGAGNLGVGESTTNTMYATVKASHVGFTASLANEVGPHGIRVNAVSPALVRTGETEGMLDEHEDRLVEDYPMGRIGEPEDVANAILFLASDAAEWISGQTISVNGGHL